MIKLKELLTISEMTYNEGPSEKHQSRIDQPITLFNEFEISEKSFPGNASKQALEELKYLVTQEGDDESIKEHDDVAKVFKKKHKELGLEFSKDEAKDLLSQSAKYIMELKYKYNRPRPYQLAEFYGLDVSKFNLESMKTPSFPSGHAIQGYLLGEYLSSIDSRNSNEYLGLGNDIAESRIIAKAHYPSDKEYGKKVAKALFKGMK